MNHPAPADAAEAAVLQLSPEPCRYHDERSVHRALTARPVEYLAFLREELARIAAGEASLELPPKQLFPDPGDAGDFRVMPCVVRRGGRVRKTIKVVGTNLAQQVVPGQITVGKALVLHPVENFVTDLFEACLLSSARTGACAALALDLLAGDCGRVSIVGAGRVGFYSALYAAAARQLREVIFCDTDGARAEAAARALRGACPGLRIGTAPRPDRDADAWILATTSRSPLCRPEDTDARVVISLGADIDTQTELDPAWSEAADLFADSADCLRFGDLHAWAEAGRIDPRRVRDLFDLLRNGVSGDRRRVFVSTGSALFDNITIGYLLEHG